MMKLKNKINSKKLTKNNQGLLRLTCEIHNFDHKTCITS
jgi:hypothetical protein